MLKRAASKIAHSTSMPILAGNLAGNKDLRALQDLITAEKSLMTSCVYPYEMDVTHLTLRVLYRLQKLSNDVIKASEALKAWGLGGGFDLGDTLSASAELYLLFATALSHFANHEATVRGHMKAVRSHEENLNELRKRRKSLAAKAGSAERRLEKMNLDNNGFLAQTELLSNLREEIRIMDADIRAEEASLNDFKHLKAKAWMELKFEGLLTCSQKGVIVGESGKLVIADISVGTTEPDLPRTSYTGHARTEHLVAEAQRSINEVVFSIDPNPNPSQHSIRSTSGSNLPSVSPSLQGDQPFRHSFVEDSRRNSSVLQAYADRANTSAIGQESRLSQGPSDHSGLPQVQESSSLSSPSPTDSAQHPTTSALHDIDEFGICPPGSNAHRSSSMRDLGKKAGSPMDDWFAIFPAKVAGPRQPPGASSSSRPSSSICTSPSVHGGEERWLLDVDPPKDLFSTIIAGALGGQWPVENSSTAGPSTSVARAGSQSGKADGVKTSSASYESPPPMYTPLVNLLPDAVPAEQQYWGDHWDQGTSLSEFDREMAQNSEGDHTVTGHGKVAFVALKSLLIPFPDKWQ
ncbi:hypothetical protein OBBRIDRAFT_835329 [Obba rivulosa]|uniref:Uncharacterized protein n=1 Tax=Obba rivulosa TaxID=1052685 RepID=A0A8E2AXT2_9APHY|nr:hypothetical protein OBBRIDRAFT_835329 [Obba rivulosa]